MLTITEQTRKMMLKKFHTICGKAGIDDTEKRVIVVSYECTSSRDLTAQQLMDAIEKIERQMNPRAEEFDRWRKRVIASIFAWRKAVGRNATMGEVKAIACRAAEVRSFNDIPMERLRSIYNAFTKKAKDIQFVDMITSEEFDYSSWVN